jgi:hypothetical protein
MGGAEPFPCPGAFPCKRENAALLCEGFKQMGVGEQLESARAEGGAPSEAESTACVRLSYLRALTEGGIHRKVFVAFAHAVARAQCAPLMFWAHAVETCAWFYAATLSWPQTPLSEFARVASCWGGVMDPAVARCLLRWAHADARLVLESLPSVGEVTAQVTKAKEHNVLRLATYAEAARQVSAELEQINAYERAWSAPHELRVRLKRKR